MCSIIDANILTTEFKKPQDENLDNVTKTAGEAFYEKVVKGKITLVGGGKLLREPEDKKNPDRIHRLWRELITAGLVKQINDDKVYSQTKKVEKKGGYKSDDPHIIALAQVSGARLLYSNDKDLQDDFDDKSLIDKPRGQVYSTLKNKEYTKTHHKLLTRTDLCKALQ